MSQKTTATTEIERKYLVQHLPANLNSYRFCLIEQAYINRQPVIRVRKSNQDYILTVKGDGLLERAEFELPLNQAQYQQLLTKKEGCSIQKIRYFIPFQTHVIQLDVFQATHSGLVLAEVEFPSLAQAHQFIPPDWFGPEVTANPAYQNVNLAFQ